MTENNNYGTALFAISFKQGFTSPNLPIATFYQGTTELKFILDTGSDTNVINKDALKYINYTLKENNGTDPTHVTGVGGRQEVETCTITFGTEDSQYTANFSIIDLSEAINGINREHGHLISGLLGSSFLKENKVVMDYATLSAYSKE